MMVGERVRKKEKRKEQKVHPMDTEQQITEKMADAGVWVSSNYSV